jgi:hypothetical protein
VEVIVPRSHIRLRRNLLFEGVIFRILALFLGSDIPMCFEKESLARSAGRMLSLFFGDCIYLFTQYIHILVHIHTPIF